MGDEMGCIVAVENVEGVMFLEFGFWNPSRSYVAPRAFFPVYVYFP